nr:preprotein translocase subunit YajC [Alcanivorax hongdengensis]
MAVMAPAYAAPAAPQGPGGIELIMLVVMMVVFYFLLIRPQQKRAKEHKNLIQALGKGDEVVTSGGILGKVVKVTDDFVVVEISNNLEIKLQKSSVQATLPKGTIKSI